MSCRQGQCKDCDSCIKCQEKYERRKKRRNKNCSKHLRRQQTLNDNNIILNDLSTKQTTSNNIDDNNSMVKQTIADNNGVIINLLSSIRQQIIDDNNLMTKQVITDNNDTINKLITSVKQQIINDNNLMIKQTIADNNLTIKQIIDDNNVIMTNLISSIKEQLKKEEKMINNFNSWTISDYDNINGINKTLNIVHKKYLYNSVIMADRRIIKLLGNHRNVDILSLNIINYLRYSNMLNIDNSFDSSLILESSLNGIQKIFQEYAEVISVTGDSISYTYLPITNADKLKMLFDIIITGRYTNGFLDINKLIEQFAILLANAKQHIKNENEVNKLKDILDNIKMLLKDDNNLISWHQLISAYQKMASAIYPSLKEIFAKNIKDESNILLHETNILIHEFYNLGRQIGSFFAFFYAITYFFHYFLDAILGENNEKPKEMNDIFEIHVEWWKDHALLITDYNKAAALDDEAALKDIENEISTSYTHITYIMEETFILFYRLIKVRNLYSILDNLRL